ncbi:hypothetical protein MKW92_017094 [Papaver armeniacum]|nr:hypothetical protein MKW92_017094 [Papaver armeniacum]
MVTFESEDDTMFSDSTSVESFNIDEIEFSTSFEEGGVIESYLTVHVFVNDQKGDFPINDQSNTQIVPVDHFGPISEQYPDASHLYRTNMRGGVYKSHKSKKEVEKSIGKKRKKDTGTKKINCPFKLSVLYGDDSKRRVTVRNGRHSHDPPESLVGHVTSSLSQEEYHRVVQLYGDGAKPATILTTMQREFPGIVCHIKTIYNAILKSKRISGDGRTSVQEFKHLCAENHYIFRSRTNINKEITDMFFAHPKFASLANTFHNFVILDNTYKTNLYDMPLLNVASHTSTKAPFTVALCFMQFEREDNFVCAFERLKEIYLYDNVPTLFLTDCSQAIIKAVKRVFPFSTHLLCTWHINKDMMAYYKPIINPPKKKKNKNKNKGDEQDEIVPELSPQERIQQNELEKEKRKKQKLEWAEFKDEWTSLCMSRIVEDFNTKYKRFVDSWDGRQGVAVRYCV